MTTSTQHSNWQDDGFDSDQLEGLSAPTPGDGVRWHREYRTAQRRVAELERRKDESDLRGHENDELNVLRARVSTIERWARDQDLGDIRQRLADMGPDDESAGQHDTRAYLKSIERLCEEIQNE